MRYSVSMSCESNKIIYSLPKYISDYVTYGIFSILKQYITDYEMALKLDSSSALHVLNAFNSPKNLCHGDYIILEE